ncbi:MAG: lipase maturation factor family protein [Alphaproteobacteria bacterium]|nr:lipase maturation factor family protein [Alphaproteobacteria bacterium]
MPSTPRPRRARKTEPGRAVPSVRRLFLTGLGVVQLIAFLSLWVQLDGLVGPRGILPAHDWLRAIEGTLVGRKELPPVPDGAGMIEAARLHLSNAWTRVQHAPTLGWFLPRTGMHLLAGAGVLASLAVIAGRLVGPALLVVWASYLSLSVLGQAFLSFQWDVLLIEVSFAAMLVAPWGWREGRAAPEAGWWLLRWILFRLVFFGGLVKLTSGDPTWRDFSALTYHYMTQPLPNPLSWSAHALPAWVHGVSAAGMFVVELLLVWGVLLPVRGVRLAAAGSIALLMAALAATGNYGFFQLLTGVLCLAALQDADLPTLRGRLAPPVVREAPSRAATWAAGTVAALLFAVSLVGIGPRYAGVELPAPLEEVRRLASPWRTVNHYGLFAVMTTERPIPVLEARWGDGEWTELTWRWQTSDVSREPAQVAPHMPRLDWQLWFAGLGTCRGNPWVHSLQKRLVLGEAPVADLVGDLRLRTARPPDATRMVLYRYAFAGSDAPEGTWWTRERLGPYCPEVRR